jgi:S-DNA-T family DNA segregation ATPase FtsK/SpoIIIE
VPGSAIDAQSRNVPGIVLPGIVLPRAPDAAQPYNFPIMACLAPVIGALVIWAITRSPLTLAFAALGPIVALASFTDAKVQARRRSRREGVRFRRQLLECADSVDELHDRERAGLLRAAPGPSGVLGAPPGDPERWRGDPASGVFVNLGLGTVPSAVRLEGAVHHADDETDAALAGLREHASILRGAPIIVDARLGIGICGPAPLANAIARGILLQLASLVSPAGGRLSVPEGAEWEWLGGLPHPRSLHSASAVRWNAGSETATVAVAVDPDLLPADCRVVLRVGDGRRVELLRHASHEAGDFFEAAFVSVEEALRGAELLSAAARERGLLVPERETVERRDFADLPETGSGRGSLRCAFAWHGIETCVVDLVADGPHAVVGGTTGSGKSELLLSWVLAMAATTGPARVNFLLVDFKGGSSFRLIESLPHVVGLITDLDERSARRALLSLRAELKFRERRLADAGARSIDELPPDSELPRLVLVVDEFAAMVTDFPELHELFADLAARGRSLGLHLILCTQRPAGVVRDAVLANAALRISLRVNNRADSVAVIGNADAADLPAVAPGRALLSLAGGRPQPVQVARIAPGDIERVAGRWRSETAAVRRPWCDDLPPVVRLEELAPVSSGLPIGLLDRPELQRQETAVYDPAVDGNLLVIGGQQSGKSGLIATLQRVAHAETLPSDIEGAWDALTGAVDRLRRGIVGPRLLLIDDLDALVARFGEEYRPAVVDLLVELLREAGSVGPHLVITARRLPAAIQAVASLSDARLVLRLSNRQDHLLAGGGPQAYVADASPGAGEWRGSRVQLAFTGAPPIEAATSLTPRLDVQERRGLVVVSRTPAGFARRVKETTETDVIELAPTARAPELSMTAATRPTVAVADPETWQSHWGLLASLRATVGILFDGCTPAEFRAISGQRALPPPLSPVSGSQWLLEPDGTLARVRLA